jgi:hypothetical protein
MSGNNWSRDSFIINSNISPYDSYFRTIYGTAGTSGTAIPRYYNTYEPIDKIIISNKIELGRSKVDSRESKVLDFLKSFGQGLTDRAWQLSYHELVHFIDHADQALLVKLQEQLPKTLQGVKGAKTNLLRWARKDRTEESKKSGLGWACMNNEQKDQVVRILESC